MTILPYLEECGFKVFEFDMDKKIYIFEIDEYSIQEFYMCYPPDKRKYCNFEFVPV